MRRMSERGSTPIVAVVGATASGKSELALDLAGALGGEVVNTDAMQVYRGMDIGTAKLAASDRSGIPHHLLDVLDIGDAATVAEFQQRARAAIDDCRTRGVPPVLVGGSALYTRAVLDRFEFPGTDPAIRGHWEERLAVEGPAALHAELAQRDPLAGSIVLPSNGRRIVRALEVMDLTGRLFSATLPTLTYFYDNAHQIGVRIPRDVLDERIATRVDRMWAAGFVDEVRRLDALGLRTSRTARAALGYQQVLAYLDGDLSEDEARERTIQATRRFSRRQDSWFSKDPRITWVDYDDPDRVEKALSSLAG
jgi:tRNA dimethylallyltransferase